MAPTAAKITPTAFKAAIGALLAVALVLASARTYIRHRRFRRLFLDDGFLLAAVVGLIIGTSVTYVNIPFVYVQVNVEAGLQAPPDDFVQQLILDQKTQDAATVFLWVAIFGVKFSFLACFRNLVRPLRNLTIWWWCVLAVTIPAAIICMCGAFIACSTFGPGVLEACVSPGALKRQNDAVKVTTVLDILTDAILISIPVALLWRVRIPLRQKLALASVLCLSVVLIIISIIKVAAVNTIQGQVDATWGVFWLQAEASVAVIVVSLAVFRSLFVPGTSKASDEPKGSPVTTRTRNSFTKLWGQKKAQEDVPTMPLATFAGARTSICGNQLGRKDSSGSENVMSPMEGPGIRVTCHISTHQMKATEKDTPSYGSFV